MDHGGERRAVTCQHHHAGAQGLSQPEGCIFLGRMPVFRSRPETVAEQTPIRPPSSPCVRPAATRWTFKRSPKEAAGSRSRQSRHRTGLRSRSGATSRPQAPHTRPGGRKNRGRRVEIA
jgi:hypothetical protein